MMIQVLGGALAEFILAPRIDNQLNCYAGLEVSFMCSCVDMQLPIFHMRNYF